MSDQTKPDPEVILSMDVDCYHEFIDSAEVIATAADRTVARPQANSPSLTVAVDEMTEFIQKAIPAGRKTANRRDRK